MFERNKVDNIEHAGTPVEITSLNGDVLKGRMLVAMGRNIFDVLNGAGGFVEFEPFGGDRTYIAKASIHNVKMINVPNARSLDERLRDMDGFEPHGILGVSHQASFEQVKAAWHKLSMAYHPDRYASAELPAEVQSYLSAMTRRVNAAYAALEAPHLRTRVVAAQRASAIYERDAGFRR